MSKKARMYSAKQNGFTIIELLIVMAILGMLAVMVAPNLFSKADGARRDAALTQISAISAVLSQHRLDVGRYPDELEGLMENTTGRASWDGPYLQNRVPKDPWGNEYFYESDGASFTLLSLGADGTQGGEDNDADIKL
jgi:general secretion pathway protein G